MKTALTLLKDDQGRTILESGIIAKIDVVKAKERSELLNVIVHVNLTKDFRKFKTLMTNHLEKSLPWANKVSVQIAPQQV